MQITDYFNHIVGYHTFDDDFGAIVVKRMFDSSGRSMLSSCPVHASRSKDMKTGRPFKYH